MAAAGASRPPAAGGRQGEKLAAQVADRIIADVMSRGWRVGEVLGAESELLSRYGVSRAVFREAVRLVEHLQVARSRRGPGGGLTVIEPSPIAVIEAMVLYLYRVDARVDEVFEARIVLEDIVCALAPGRLDEADVHELRKLAECERSGDIDDPRALHARLATAANNPALELFVNVLIRITALYSNNWRTVDAPGESPSSRAHERIIDAVVAGDSGRARHRMRRHLRAEGEFLLARRSTRRMLPDEILSDSVGTKRAEQVARQLAAVVVLDDLPPGTPIGSEPELLARLRVSRAVLREAVRILEHHHLARMRRGPGGGLFVAALSADAVTDVVAIYLACRGLTPQRLFELRIGVELAIVELAVERSAAAGAARMEEAMDREVAASEDERAATVHDLHAAVAALSGNRVLELVALVLIRLTRLHQIERLGSSDIDRIRREVQHTHQGIARAVAAGDADLARHRMRRHLEAVSAMLPT